MLRSLRKRRAGWSVGDSGEDRKATILCIDQIPGFTSGSVMSLRERTRPGLGIVEPCLPSPAGLEARLRGLEGSDSMTMRYRLKDDGYPTLQKIVRGRETVGRVAKNADGSFTGIIRGVTATGTSWIDALNQVVAKIEGGTVAELGSDLIQVKPVQEHTAIILDFLRNNAEANGGHLIFNNADLAHVIGWRRPEQRRPLGNLISRLDACCFKAGLPPIGCAAEAPFREAWLPSAETGRYRHNWRFKFPVERMQRRAKSYCGTDADFDRIQRESLALGTGSGVSAWDELYAKHEAKVEEWAYQQ